MNKIRAKIKSLLLDTFLYDYAKTLYSKYKLATDRRIFKRHYPKANYISFTKKEILAQRTSGYHSQYGQDYFLWNKFFSGRSAGTFIDIGANRAAINSNSYFLEQKGWTGIAIDPLKQFTEEWLELRTTPLMCGAVSDTIGEQAFIEILPSQGWEHALSGFKGLVRDEDLKIYQYKEYTIDARPLIEYLPNHGSVDLIMIDVEGAEIQVLKGIDFALFSPRYILVENDSILGGSESIRDYLKDRGYECAARIAATDDFFIKI